ncbi:ATP-binding protein [Aliamphritea hakodatensis]|uniref:ATP-binding protein n=1 Tax=Aliamphritea hakodatensis TaxID=2895352 RepID=UPI0022FD51D0|nr:ATP-binding protein [Aliamphritea hakodatensis]
METIETSSNSVKNEFSNFHTDKIISEYIWNSFDANANEVKINYEDNDLGTIDSLHISDNGDGIDPEHHEATFGKYKDSPKKKNSSPTIKGQKGLGRFSFHKISSKAIWDSVSTNSSCSISIGSDSLNNYEVNHKRDFFQPQNTGTNIEFIGMHEKSFSRSFIENSVIPTIQKEFSWLLVANNKNNIYVNNERLEVLEHVNKTYSNKIGEFDFEVKVVIWKEKPKENSYIYFTDSQNKVCHKELSKVNLKTGFYTSSYVSSSFFNNFDANHNDMISSPQNIDSDEYKHIKRFVRDKLKDLLLEFRNKAADKLIEEYESEGIFPEHSDDSVALRGWKHESLKDTIKVLYSADPKIFSSGLNKTQKKILIKLLDRITLNPNDDLFDVLNGVISLSREEERQLAKILKVTTLSNITKAIDEIKQRQYVLQIINSLNEDYTKETKEVGEIQSIVENNLWLFGEQYHLLTAEEPDFEAALCELLKIHGNENYYQKGSLTNKHKNKEMDIFSIRRTIEVDEIGNEYYRCLVVELKRPSDTLKDKHYTQIQNYYSVISSSPLFNDGKHKWDFILTGRKITDDPNAKAIMQGQLNSMKPHGEPGLLLNTDNFRMYVKPWGTIFSDHSIRHKHLLKHLKLNQNKQQITSPKEELVNKAITIGQDISNTVTELDFD